MRNTNEANNATVELAFWTVTELESGCAPTDAVGVWNKAFRTLDGAKLAVAKELQERNDECGEAEPGETFGAIDVDWHEDGDGRWIGWVEDFDLHVFVTRTTLA